MPLRRADWFLFLGAFAILGLLAVMVANSPAYGVAAAVVVGFSCIAVIARVPAGHVGAGFIALFAFTCSWDVLEISTIPVRYLALLSGIGLLGLVQVTKALPPIPWWVYLFAVTAIAVTALQTVWPVSQEYLDSRYLTSEAGVALGSRPDPLVNLIYLLLNVFLVPVGIVLAVMAVPRSLRLIVYSFVAGSALSNLGAYLGFIGFPWVVDLVGDPIQEGIRALGYTGHPLLLATSAVMSLAPAIWMALQPARAVRWFGRLAFVAIVLGLYSSGSRGGNVAGLLVVALCVLLLPAIRRRWRTVAAVVMSMVSLVLAFVPAAGVEVLNTTRVVGGGQAAQASDRGRGQLFEQGILDFAESPIYGIGTRFLGEAHFLYAGLLASGGVIMFAGYVLFTVGSLRDAFRAMSVDRSLGGAIAATLVASLAYWTVADLFTGAVVQTVYGVLIAMGIPQVREELMAALGASGDRTAGDLRERKPNVNQASAKKIGFAGGSS